MRFILLLRYNNYTSRSPQSHLTRKHPSKLCQIFAQFYRSKFTQKYITKNLK
nr:MAG TPA: hypothetical protein [Caudoviricetes sp.]